MALVIAELVFRRDRFVVLNQYAKAVAVRLRKVFQIADGEDRVIEADQHGADVQLLVGVVQQPRAYGACAPVVSPIRLPPGPPCGTCPRRPEETFHFVRGVPRWESGD